MSNLPRQRRSISTVAQPPQPVEAFFAQRSNNPLRDAFPGKRPVRPIIDSHPVPQSELPDRWRTMLATPRHETTVAYMHIPFCENHCVYCGFYQNPWREAAGSAYVDTLIKQLEGGRDNAAQQGHPVRAVYLGGGTPSVLSAHDLTRLVKALRRYLPLAADCEITLEGRIASFGLDKAQAAFAAGVNRVSVGVQSFDDRIRRSMGRKATGSETRRFLERLVALDQATIVIDLLYGLPGQTEDIWRRDLNATISLALDGVDLYSLHLIPGTPLLKAIDKGKLTPLAASELGAFYQTGATQLHAAGWETISTTHWRHGFRERNIYNHAIKSGAQCLAFGAGAGGSLAGYSYRMLADLNQYRDAISNGQPPIAGLMKASPLQAVADAICAGMELGRLNLKVIDNALKAENGADFQALATPLLQQWQAAGLIESSDRQTFVLTLAGRFWQVSMTQRLLQWTLQQSAHR